MSREAHVRFCEGPQVKSLRSTHPYIRTHEGWLYLAVVLDLFSRQVVGWSMRSRIDSELAINALAPGRVTAATEDSVDRSF
jgi:putative transposase